ncbi:MAG: ATP-dependent zinc protease [Bdellovibrionales bacterium]|nr:ATP-dependent zinc protease [Bdellovibrionales bacterium]
MEKVSKKSIGWREWVKFPDLKIPSIKAKVDTGARTSALHATHLEIKKRGSVSWVYFKVHPSQVGHGPVVSCHAKLIEYRKIRSSNGHLTVRPVISTNIQLGDDIWSAEFTLVDREMMGFRMLLGREAIRRKFLVDAGRSFLIGKKKKKKIPSKI